jgi:ketosteroid isomerase-like protein
MSHEDLIRASYRAWGEADLEGLLETLDPDIVFRTSGTFPDFAPVYRGHDGMREFWEDFRAPWEWVEIQVERIVKGDDCAALVIRFRSRGRGSGVMTDLHQGHAVRFKNDRVVGISAHASLEQALEAAGLSEQDAHTDS